MINQTNNQAVLFEKFHRPSSTPLPNGIPVTFSANEIDVAIDRGVKRLECFVNANPLSENWVCFGWIDGGLDSPAVTLPIGALRMIEGDVEYMANDNPLFAIPFENDWQRVSFLMKQVLIKDFEPSDLHDSTEPLSLVSQN